MQLLVVLGSKMYFSLRRGEASEPNELRLSGGEWVSFVVDVGGYSHEPSLSRQ